MPWVNMPRPNDNEVQVLWSTFHTFRRRVDRDKLIDRYLPLSRYVASQITKKLTTHVDPGDIYSYAAIGLIDAIERFDPSLGFKFETYAVTRIKGAVYDELRSDDWVPRSVRDKAKDIHRAQADLINGLGRLPTEREVAVEIGVSEDVLRTSMTQMEFAQVESVEAVRDDPVFVHNKFMGQEGDASETSGVLEMRDALAAAIAVCGDRERVVLTLYYYEGLTLEEIGTWMGVTESRVCQIHTRAMEQIRGGLRVA